MKQFNFTDTTVFGGTKLERLPPTATPAVVIDNSPVSVVLVHEKIVDGHNGIFLPEFQSYLASYVAFIGRRRLIPRHDRLEREIAARRAARATDAVNAPLENAKC